MFSLPAQSFLTVSTTFAIVFDSPLHARLWPTVTASVISLLGMSRALSLLSIPRNCPSTTTNKCNVLVIDEPAVSRQHCLVQPNRKDPDAESPSSEENVVVDNRWRVLG